MSWARWEKVQDNVKKPKSGEIGCFRSLGRIFRCISSSFSFIIGRLASCLILPFTACENFYRLHSLYLSVKIVPTLQRCFIKSFNLCKALNTLAFSIQSIRAKCYCSQEPQVGIRGREAGCCSNTTCFEYIDIFCPQHLALTEFRF